MGQERTSILTGDDEKTAETRERLETERAGWLTTVTPDGTPQSSPVWFVWKGDHLYMYSMRSPRVRNIEANPRVSFNLDGNRQGGEVVVVEATAAIDESAPSVADDEVYLAKYGSVMRERGWAPDWFGERYPVFIRVTPTRVRHW